MKAHRKTSQLQIRVSPEQKTAIDHYAKNAGMALSQWVLNKILPPAREVFQELLAQLKSGSNPKLILAQMHDLLSKVTPDEFELMVALPPRVILPQYLANYIAAMIEYTAVQKKRKAPLWTRQIPPLDEPKFVSDLKSLRLHLLTHSPPPFRRRNLFIDTTVGGRV
jgi:hypothetical protein